MLTMFRVMICWIAVLVGFQTASAHTGFESETEVRIFADRMDVCVRTTFAFGWKIMGSRAPADVREAGRKAAKLVLTELAPDLFDVSTADSVMKPKKVNCVFELDEHIAFLLTYDRPSGWPLAFTARFFNHFGSLDSGTIKIFDQTDAPYQRDIGPVVVKRLFSNDPVLSFSRGPTPSVDSAKSPSPPGNLRVNDADEPVGTGADVYFGWLVHDPDPDEIQSRYQILVASSEGGVWDSGPTESRAQNHVVYNGPALQSDRRYHWKVRTWDKDGKAGPYSAPATFGVGLLSNDDWSEARWIRRNSKDADDCTYFRYKAELPAKEIVRATAYIAACHKYEIYLNGTLFGKGPAYHHPQFQYYNAFDVTPLLNSGMPNQFAIFHRWFGGGQGRAAGARGVIMKTVVHYKDGTSTIIATDGAWKQSRAPAWLQEDPIARNRGEGVGYVERIDGRLLEADWPSLSFDDSSWKPAEVIGPHPTAPWTGTLAPDLTRIVENEIAPASITALGGGKYVIDLGKLHAGMPKIRFSGGVPGTVVEMRGGEVLNSSGEIPLGTKAQATDMAYRATLSGGSFTYLPAEYLGMRWFQIDNSPMPVTRENFSFIVRHNRMDSSASSFESADPAVNAVWELMKHSMFTCAQEEFVDTPTREKGGFLGDSAIQSSVAMPVLNERLLTHRALGEFLQSMDQHWSAPADHGRMNSVYPNNDGGRDIPDFTLAYPLWVWRYYMETGDRTFLSKYYAQIAEIDDYIQRHTDSGTGLVTRLTGGSGPYQHGIIDWPATMRFGYDMETEARTVINGWAFACHQTMSRIAGELGKPAERDVHQARADALKNAINSRFLTPAGVYIDGLHADGKPSTHASQHANMFPLALGIVPQENRAAVINHIKGKGMSVGMVTVQWLVRALAEANDGPALLALLTNPKQPGWAKCLASGATATWESWDADTTGQSLSHAWGAAGLDAHIRHILGIRPLQPQYADVLIQPLDFGDKLDWAKGKITTDRGEISVHWQRAADSYTLRVTLPANVTARIAMPRGSSTGPIMRLDGQIVPTTVEGGFLVVSGVGSGEHTLVRQER